MSTRAIVVATRLRETWENIARDRPVEGGGGVMHVGVCVVGGGSGGCGHVGLEIWEVRRLMRVVNCSGASKKG